jgi:hypothetical protein
LECPVFSEDVGAKNSLESYRRRDPPHIARRAATLAASVSFFESLSILHEIVEGVGGVWRSVVKGLAAKGVSGKMLPDDGMA